MPYENPQYADPAFRAAAKVAITNDTSALGLRNKFSTYDFVINAANKMLIKNKFGHRDIPAEQWMIDKAVFVN